MASVSDTIKDALVQLRVQDANEPVDADIFASSVRALNRMMRRWEADGLALAWMDVSNPADVLPAPPEAEQAIIDNLSIVLRPQFGGTLDPDVMMRAKQGLHDLERDNTVANPLVLRTKLPFRGRWNIYTDSDGGY